MNQTKREITELAMGRGGVVRGAAGIALILAGVCAAAAQDDPRLPQGPNRNLVLRRCTTCHDISNLFSTVGKTREGWDSKLDDMVLYGLEITSQERTLILDYLATYLPKQ
jgi:hypothetical protein